MGVNPTPTNYKTFTFAGENSRNYGVYITGEGVFNAPERNVEMIDIPGRNGAFALDKGNFNNVEVTYPAGIVADTETDFADAVSDLRNLLCSQTGYVRLGDDYNPNEYRLAIYKSGLEVSHEGLLNGEFDIVFECKPQRYLKSGETAISVTSGDTITNPTRFEAHPLLEVVGYGSIAIGGSGTIIAQNAIIGKVLLAPKGTDTVIGFNGNVLDTGDTINVNGITIDVAYEVISASFNYAWPEDDGYTASNCTVNIHDDKLRMAVSATTFAKGTAKTVTASYQYAVFVERSDETIVQATASLSADVSYDGNGTIVVTITENRSPSTGVKANILLNTPDIFGDSTKSALGNPMYIDLDIGEAYNMDYGTMVSVNNSVAIPAELPTLPSGATTITYDNTFTSFEIVPRWWKV